MIMPRESVLAVISVEYTRSSVQRKTFGVRDLSDWKGCMTMGVEYGRFTRLSALFLLFDASFGFVVPILRVAVVSEYVGLLCDTVRVL